MHRAPMRPCDIDHASGEGFLGAPATGASCPSHSDDIARRGVGKGAGDALHTDDVGRHHILKS